jgi:hypothetical protein
LRHQPGSECDADVTVSVAALLGVVAIIEVIFGVGVFASRQSITQEIAGLDAFGFGVLTIATVWGFRAIYKRWENRWTAQDVLAELDAARNQGRYIPE